MANISKILPACGFAIGVALVAVTSAFKEAPKGKQASFWVLKSGASVGSTDPSDYQEGSNDCSRTIHFCGFSAPDNGSGEPDISAVTNLTADLNNLAAHPNQHFDASGEVTYMDN